MISVYFRVIIQNEHTLNSQQLNALVVYSSGIFGEIFKKCSIFISVECFKGVASFTNSTSN